jgi:hypothetical protein
VVGRWFGHGVDLSLDHVIVWNERALRRHLQRYLAYYHE